MVGVTIIDRSANGALATLETAGHPTVCAVVVSRDLGDLAGRSPTLRGVPCLLLDFTTPEAADAVLARLAALSSKMAYKETATRLACSSEIHYALRVVRGFDEAAIATIAAHHEEASARYALARRDSPRHGVCRERR